MFPLVCNLSLGQARSLIPPPLKFGHASLSKLLAPESSQVTVKLEKRGQQLTLQPITYTKKGEGRDRGREGGREGERKGGREGGVEGRRKRGRY